MRTADSVTRQIQQANDIVDVISRYVRLTRAGQNLKGLCPFHKEKSPSFHVHAAKQIFKCFGCGAGGDVFKFVQLRENVAFPEARRMLADRAGIKLDSLRTAGQKSSGPDRAEIARVNAWAAQWFARQLSAGPAGAAAREYALKRGLSPAMIERFRLGFAPDSWEALSTAAATQRIPAPLLVGAGLVKPRDNGNGHYDVFRDRLMFPIRDPMDRVIGFGGRTLSEDPAKYLNTSQTALFDKSRSMFGLDAARDGIPERACAIVVEGYTDCIMAHQHGFTHTVATLGTALTESHAELLSRYTDSIFLVFDSDDAGQRAADRALPMFLSQRLHVRMARVPEGKDPCDYLNSHGPAAFEQVLNSAPDALEFKWHQVERRYQETAHGPGRMRAIQEFLDLIGQAIDFGAIEPIQRGLIVNQIAKLVGVDRGEIHQRLTPSTSTRRPAVPADSAAARVSAFAMPAMPDASSASTRALLEVLLNEPGYYASVAEWFDPARLPEPLRRVAQTVIELAGTIGEYTLADVLACFDDVDTARCAMALQDAGERQGNYAAAVEGAVSRLQQEALRARILSRQDALESAAAARQLRHFCSPKFARLHQNRRAAGG